MAQQNVYWYALTDLRFKVLTPQGQLPVHVAADSMKRAAELFGCNPNDIRQYGGIDHNKAVQAMCRAEPETPFVQVSHGEYFRLGDDPEDPAKRVLIDMTDEDTYGRKLQHPSYGMMNVSRISGRAALFQVDYPQDHFIEVTIETASITRRSGNDHVMADREIIKVAMSEVQWARMISSPNTSGVPVTLRRYQDPESGEFLAPHLPDEHTQNLKTFREAIERKAQLAMENVNAARARLEEIMKGPLRKGDIAEVVDLLTTANREAVANLPYVVETANETIVEAAENAKTEIGAFHDFAMLKLGERAFGEHIAKRLGAGADFDPREVARIVADEIAAPALEDKSKEGNDGA